MFLENRFWNKFMKYISKNNFPNIFLEIVFEKYISKISFRKHVSE